MFDPRTRLAEDVVREVREHFVGEVYSAVVPRSVRLSEAPSFGQPIALYDARSKGAKAYRALAREIAQAVQDGEWPERGGLGQQRAASNEGDSSTSPNGEAAISQGGP